MTLLIRLPFSTFLVATLLLTFFSLLKRSLFSATIELLLHVLLLIRLHVYSILLLLAKKKGEKAKDSETENAESDSDMEMEHPQTRLMVKPMVYRAEPLEAVEEMEIN